MFYGQVVAKKFGFQHPTRVLFDYKIHHNEFAMTYIETMQIPDRPTTFETIISPFKTKIKIPTEFHELWKREIHRLKYGRIVAGHHWAHVTFEKDDTNFYMNGNDVSEVFGLDKTIKVLLDYKIKNNDFHMTFISVVEDAAPQVMEEAEEEDNGEDHEDNGEDHVQEEGEQVTVTWYTTVTKSLANLSKKQVMHFPNPISRGVLANVNNIQLISDDTHFEAECQVHTSKRSLQTGEYEKHIGKGWYDYVRLHRPRAGDTLRFVLFPETDELNVRLIRQNMHQN
ncbi:hypothetical protein L195_g041098 [Trifolium pratense]|uniref:TF-B3 domain-containing protein n=1 Tax=Trifolium pratense TaxID=57577 RepID=A0A2K3M2Q7_TRIPR|nr:hypothetical protein L195_g041098 [Trifolium pratense]